ncbi:MAG TPA: hypothetical protein VFA26_00775, partial [Gemmataceae bacterium]|nr:hypothetical protein [Gemmataceae bacterium]
GQVEEWVSLANRGGMDDCKDEATRLYRRLPAKDPKYKDYQAGLERHQWAIRRAIVLGKQARDLEEALSALLEDRGDPDAPDRPDMVEFWSKPELKALRADVITLRDKVRFGDPLVLSKRFGRGRVVASLTTLGPAWNDWASGPAAPAFVVMILEMQNYLLGASGRDCLTGSRAAVEADAARFEPKARCAYLPNRPHSGEGKAQDLGELLGNVAGGRVTITLDDTSRPGVYLFRLKPRGGGAEEVRAVAVNVDPAESDLERAPAAALEKLAPGGKGKLTLYRSEGRR